MRQIFLLMYYLGFDYEQARRLPIQYRRWFIEETQREINEQTQNGEGVATKGAHDNHPLQQAYRGQLPGTPPGRRRPF